MKRYISLALSFFLFVQYTASAAAQETDQQLFDRALPEFTRLIKSEEPARTHLTYLRNYADQTSVRFSTLILLSRRLHVAGLNRHNVIDIIEPSGDAIATLDGSEEDFAEMVLILGNMKLKNVEAYAGLSRINDIGIPAFQILGEMTGKSADFIKDAALRGKLKTDAASDIMREGLRRRYEGAARRRRA